MSAYMSKSYGKGGGGGSAKAPTSVNSPRNGPDSGGSWKTTSGPTFSRVTPWAGGTSGPGKAKKGGM